MKNGHQEVLLEGKHCKQMISKTVHLLFCLLCVYAMQRFQGSVRGLWYHQRPWTVRQPEFIWSSPKHRQWGTDAALRIRVPLRACGCLDCLNNASSSVKHHSEICSRDLVGWFFDNNRGRASFRGQVSWAGWFLLFRHAGTGFLGNSDAGFGLIRSVFIGNQRCCRFLPGKK